MWALRRVSNPMRNQYLHIVVACSCCADAGVLRRSSENGGHSVRGKHIIGGHIFVKPYSHECDTSAKSFFWSRKFSYMAGAESGDSEDELEDGFSNLERAPETNKIADVVDLQGNFSEEELDETAYSEKKAARSKATSSLFTIIIETSRGHIDRALDTWVKEGKPLDQIEISMTLLNLRKRRFYAKALQFTEWIEANINLDLTEGDYASHLDLIAKVHGMQKAEKFIDNIPESFKTEVIYRTLLANWVATGNVKKSEEFFNKMRDLGFRMTAFACNQLLLLYKRIDRKKVADVLMLMEKEHVKPTVFTYRILIDVKGRANDISGMEDVVEMMKAEGIELDIGIHAMLAKYYIYGNLKKKAEAEVKEIEGDDVTKNRAACKELLPLYASLGKPDDVKRIWKVCEAEPHPEECLAAIEAWGKLGQIENAEEVYERMMKTWNGLSSKYYNALLKVYADHKLLSKGKDLAKRMSENGCRVGPLTWDAIVKLYVDAGEVEKADLILEKATQQSQMRPLYSSYMAVLQKYAKRGDIQNAEKIFHKLRQCRYTGRMTSYQVLLQAYVNAKTPAFGVRERMKADNMFPNKSVTALIMAVDAFKKTEISSSVD